MLVRWRPSVAPVRGQETRAQRQVLSRPQPYPVPAPTEFISVERVILHYPRPSPDVRPRRDGWTLPQELDSSATDFGPQGLS